MEIRFAELAYSNGTGYGFANRSSDLTEADLGSIREKALPRGDGWASYIGMESLKSFRLNRNWLAISRVRVTDQRDEYGRSGILGARVEIFSDEGDYLRSLEDRLRQLVSGSRLTESDLQPPPLFRVIEQVVANHRVLLSRHFTGRVSWIYVEAAILKAVLSLPRHLSTSISFTTFALSPYGESFIVAVPLVVAESLKRPFIRA